MALRSPGFIDNEAALFDSGPLNQELQKYIENKPGDDK